jgi:hypothetical protein
MADTSRSDSTLNETLGSRTDSSPTVLDSLSISAEDSLIGLNQEQVILHNSLVTGRDSNLNPFQKSGTQSTQDFIANERSDMPQNNYSTKRKRDDSPDSSSVAPDDEGK